MQSLLARQISIDGDEGINAGAGDASQQFAVPQSRPTFVLYSGHPVAEEVLAQGVRQAFVQDHPHLNRRGA